MRTWHGERSPKRSGGGFDRICLVRSDDRVEAVRGPIRAVVSRGILWILWTGAPWSELPPRYGSATTSWRRLREWEENEVLLALWRAFLTHLDDRQKLRKGGLRRQTGPSRWFPRTRYTFPHSPGHPRHAGRWLARAGVSS